MNDRHWGLEADEADGIRRVLSAHPEVTKAMVYGSRALGTHRPGSDIDLTLAGQIKWAELHQIETELDNLDLPYTIDLSIESQIENPALLQHIKDHGQTIYERTREPEN